MNIGYWSVIESEDGTRFACQRTPIFGDEEFETTEWTGSQAAAEAACEHLNNNVESELASLPDHLK